MNGDAFFEDMAEKIESRIEALLPLWADGDSPARARDDLERAKAGLAAATGALCFVQYDVENGRTQCETCAESYGGEGTDEMHFLVAGLDAASRLIIMGGAHPREEIVSLLREKLALYERQIPTSG